MEVNPHLNEEMNKLELKKQRERERRRKIWLLFAWKYFPSNWREMNRKMEWQTWRTRNVLNCASLCFDERAGDFLASVHLCKILNFKIIPPLTYWLCLQLGMFMLINEFHSKIFHQIISHSMSVCSITANSLNTNLNLECISLLGYYFPAKLDGQDIFRKTFNHFRTVECKSFVLIINIIDIVSITT